MEDNEVIKPREERKRQEAVRADQEEQKVNAAGEENKPPIIIAQEEQIGIKNKQDVQSNHPSQRSEQEQIPMGQNRRNRRDRIEPSEDYRRAQEAVLRLGGKVNMEEEKRLDEGLDEEMEGNNGADEQFLQSRQRVFISMKQ